MEVIEATLFILSSFWFKASRLVLLIWSNKAPFALFTVVSTYSLFVICNLSPNAKGVGAVGMPANTGDINGALLFKAASVTERIA